MLHIRLMRGKADPVPVAPKYLVLGSSDKARAPQWQRPPFKQFTAKSHQFQKTTELSVTGLVALDSVLAREKSNAAFLLT